MSPSSTGAYSYTKEFSLSQTKFLFIVLYLFSYNTAVLLSKMRGAM